MPPRFPHFLSLLFAAVLLATVCQAKPLNVVLFLVDDMSLDAGVYGNSVVQTPNIDKLASQGTLFSDAYCTTASCSPSRAVIMTGLQNHANGQYGLAHLSHNFKTRPEVVTLPTRLREAGYRTARYGRAVHVRPYAQYAFDVTVPNTEEDGLSLADRLYGRDIIKCVNDTESFITADDSQPFFLMIPTCDSHRFGGRFDELPGTPNSFANNHSYQDIAEKLYDPSEVIVPPYLSDNIETRAELAQYYQSITRLDQGLGRLMDLLEETGHRDDTVIIFTADHGAPFPGSKATTYDPGLHVPFIVYDPSVTSRGVTSEAMLSHVDITPTILDYAGALPSDSPFHGRSIRPLLGNESPDGWNEIYASHTFHEVTMYYPMRVVQERRYKLIWNIAHELEFPLAQDLWQSSTWQSILTSDTPSQKLGLRRVQDFLHRPEFELYDMQADPDESQNLANDPSHKTDFDRLLAKIKAFQEATEDPWTLKWEHE